MKLPPLGTYTLPGPSGIFEFGPSPDLLCFTDATTWGDARALYADGWEPGAPGGAGVRGIRVHLIGTRVERVVTPGDVVVEPAGGPAAAGGHPS